MNEPLPPLDILFHPEIARLPELAYNLWFSWNDDALDLFAMINRDLWEQYGHNPVRLLAETPPGVWEPLSRDAAFLDQYRKVIRQWDKYRKETTWFQKEHPDVPPHRIAYFSAEFGFHESLPIYSGGLGILAGDHCKSASDLGVPLTGVGLLYKKGYFRQQMDSEGRQQAEAVSYDFTRLPVLPVYSEQGEELRVSVPLADRAVQLKLWQVAVGRNSVYLLDADVEENSSQDRELTAQLYGGNSDTRIAQELILGLGGLKALRALGLPVAVYHINEGHAAFQAFERLREQLDQGTAFSVAVEWIRASSVFTTHTPVPAGHDAFPRSMVEHYLGSVLAGFGEHREAAIRLGMDDSKQLFNMTHLALNTAALRNGVSRLHGEVSRDMFRSFHGNIDARDVPISHVTNGVHMGTWLAPEFKALYSRHLPAGWSSGQTGASSWNAIASVPTEALWEAHMQLKRSLIRFARTNLLEQRQRNGLSAAHVEEVDSYLSPDTLTIGFARRFATYKRANLIFKDTERLDRLVNNRERPVQFLFAGKAHPADQPGQDMIRDVYRLSQMDRFRGKIVLLENYDINLARYLVQGVDVWLNNPRRPYEASGTSGQKAAMNGVLNFSVLDGWWEEGYDGSNGWSIYGSNDADWQTQEHENTESIYRLLEQEIVPLYYSGGKLPLEWIERMKRSIQTLAPIYNTDRMVMDYADWAYIPSLRRILSFAADNGDIAEKVANFKAFIRENWHHVRFLELSDDISVKASASKDTLTVNDTQREKEWTATVRFGPVWYKDTVVEALYYEEHSDGWHRVIVPMEPFRELDNRVVQFRAKLPAHLRHGEHFSIRIRPVSPNFATPFELPLVTSL